MMKRKFCTSGLGRRKLRVIISLLSALLFFSVCMGCASTPLDLGLDFPVEKSSDAVGQTVPATIGVAEFIDLRPRAATSDAHKWLGFIPGVLWLHMESEMPDTYIGFTDYSPAPFPTAFSRAVYNALKGNEVFAQCVFLPENPYVTADYRLEGALNRTYLRETGYYYGSGLYAWITRIVGLPYVSFEVEIDVTLRLREMSSGEIIWKYDITGYREDKFYSVYALSRGIEGKNVLSYNISSILAQRMPDALASMREALNQEPASRRITQQENQ